MVQRRTGTFVPGARMRGTVTYPGYEHVTFDIMVDFQETWRPTAATARTS